MWLFHQILTWGGVYTTVHNECMLLFHLLLHDNKIVNILCKSIQLQIQLQFQNVAMYKEGWDNSYSEHCTYSLMQQWITMTLYFYHVHQTACSIFTLYLAQELCNMLAFVPLLVPLSGQWCHSHPFGSGSPRLCLHPSWAVSWRGWGVKSILRLASRHASVLWRFSFSPPCSFLYSSLRLTPHQKRTFVAYWSTY